MVTAVYDMPDVKAQLTLTYHISGDGRIKVAEQLKTDKDAKQPDMARFGMVMQLPYEMERSAYYGRALRTMVIVSCRSVSESMTRQPTNSSVPISVPKKMA